MYLMWQSYNTQAVSAGKVYGASGAFFIDGAVFSTGAKYSRAAATTALTTAPKTLISVRNNTTINSIANRSTVTLDSVNFYAIDNSVSNNNNSVILYVVLNPTISGGSYTNVDAVNSIVSYNTTNTYSGGTVILTYTTCFSTGLNLELTKYNIHLNVGDVVVFALASLVNAASCTAGVSVAWSENT
jgi:hypothetical protein